MTKILIDPNCNESLKEAAKELNTTLEALQAAIRKAMAQMGNHAVRIGELAQEVLDKFEKEPEDIIETLFVVPLVTVCPIPLSRIKDRPRQKHSGYGWNNYASGDMVL